MFKQVEVIRLKPERIPEEFDLTTRVDNSREVTRDLDVPVRYSNISSRDTIEYRRDFSPVRRYFSVLDRDFTLGEAGTEDDLSDSEVSKVVTNKQTYRWTKN